MIGLLLGNWQRLLIYGVVALLIAGMLELDGYRRGEKKLFEYQAKQAIEAVKIVQKRGEVVTKTEVKWRTVINTIIKKGETITKEVPVYVTKQDDAACTVPIGFVREYNAAWSGEPAGPPAESDRGPSGVPLSAVAEADAVNATSALYYKAQRDGLIEFYRKQQALR